VRWRHLPQFGDAGIAVAAYEREHGKARKKIALRPAKELKKAV
jgi:hypothetical protein